MTFKTTTYNIFLVCIVVTMILNVIYSFAYNNKPELAVVFLAGSLFIYAYGYDSTGIM